MTQITQLLQRMHAGDAGARDAMFAVAYEELRRLARARLDRSDSPVKYCFRAASARLRRSVSGNARSGSTWSMNFFRKDSRAGRVISRESFCA